MNYALSFGSLTALLVHTGLLHYRKLLDKFRASSVQEDNAHVQNYKSHYSEVPDMWYMALFIITMILSIIVCEAWDTRLPFWGFLGTQLIPFIFTVPIGFVQAVTNVRIGILMLRCC
jgi:hypothetical protein